MEPNPLPAKREDGLPPVLADASTPVVRVRVESFFSSVASIFESWVNRRRSIHTRRAYREDGNVKPVRKEAPLLPSTSAAVSLVHRITRKRAEA
jgi:hypothetical protein